MVVIRLDIKKLLILVNDQEFYLIQKYDQTVYHHIVVVTTKTGSLKKLVWSA